MPFKDTQGFDASIVRPQITPALLPYTIALMEALRLPRPLVGPSVMALLDKLYSRGDHFSTCVPQLSTGHVQQMQSTYYAIDAVATDFAVCALERISPKGTVVSANAPLSPAEHFRFRRAFY
jgi:hypothetical protein